MKYIKLPENEVIECYLSNHLSMSDICYKFGVSKFKIRKILKENNIKSKSSKKYNYNDSIFEKIDTEEKAYWLGFLYADGYVRVRKGVGSELRLKLAVVDKNHLIKFRYFISPDDIPMVYEEYKNSRTFKVSINSNKIVNDLINLGCVNNKSKVIKFPLLESNLITHFIRGYFDGDGSVSFTDKYIGLNFVSGSKYFLKEISNILENFAKCKNANLVGISDNYKYIQYNSKEDLYKLYDFLYKDSYFFLERKRIKYDYIIKNFNELKDRINMVRRNMKKK